MKTSIVPSLARSGSNKPCESPIRRFNRDLGDSGTIQPNGKVWRVNWLAEEGTNPPGRDAGDGRERTLVSECELAVQGAERVTRISK